MPIKLPRIISRYVDASNKHDVNSILSCFSDGARVQDEGEALHGKKAIEGWITKTIEKDDFQLKPLDGQNGDGEVVVAMEVSGTFDGSPVSVEYHFTIENDEISALTIE